MPTTIPTLYVIGVETSKTPPFPVVTFPGSLGDPHIPPPGSEALILGSPDHSPYAAGDMVRFIYKIGHAFPSGKRENPVAVRVTARPVPNPLSFSALKDEVVFIQQLPYFGIIGDSFIPVHQDSAAAIRALLGLWARPVPRRTVA